MSSKIILFELNEVPMRIVNEFCSWRPNSALARNRAKFHEYEAYTENIGHLSPWGTWPSLHRGVNNDKHLIRDFGQDLRDVDQEFPPLWEVLARNGVRSGICGTLHTYPLPEDLTGYDFFIPDTFAAGSECFPDNLTLFQDFNLSMARESARNVSTRIPWKGALQLLARAPELGFRMGTFVDIGSQVLSERVQSWRRVRRRTYQSVLAFDVFMKQLEKTKPAFSSFFTNHVASSMHRFWAARFPDDYEEFGFEDAWVKRYRNEIDFTMHKFDLFLGRLLNFVDSNPGYSLWIATSMGQAATLAEPLETQLYATDLVKFLEKLGLAKDDWKRMPSMMPQFNIVVNPDKVTTLKESLDALVIDGEPIVYRVADHGFFSIDLGQRNIHLKPQHVVFRGEVVPFAEMSLGGVEIEDKSGANAYHIPEGCLMIYDPERMPAASTKLSSGNGHTNGNGVNGSANGNGHTSISTLDIAPAILQNFSVEVPEYMKRPPTLISG